MIYNNFTEWMKALKSRVLLQHVKNVADASFKLTNNGVVSLEFITRFPHDAPMMEPLFKLEVHPWFAWGIYQLMSDLNTMQAH